MSGLLGGRYRLVERLATGGMGSVHRALDEVLDRPVAVKLLKPRLLDDPTFLERFRREARAAAAVVHPNVAAVYDYGEADDHAYIVMELVEGETLAQRIDRRGALPWREAFTIGEQVAQALAAAHALGLVHRDIKPANILLGRDGQVKVTDFGIALAAQATTLTRTGVILGSASYVAPEQAQGGDVGPTADLYALGCVLYEAVTDAPPYQGPSPVAVASQHVSAPVPDPRRLRPDLPLEVAAVTIRAMAKDPARRFASAGELAGVLHAAVRQAGPQRPATAVGQGGILPAAAGYDDRGDAEARARVRRAATPIPATAAPAPRPAGPAAALPPAPPAAAVASGNGAPPPPADHADHADHAGPPADHADHADQGGPPAGAGRPAPRGLLGRAVALTLAAAALLVPAWLWYQGSHQERAGQPAARTPPASPPAGVAAERVAVPDVVGLPAGAARAALRARGFRVAANRARGRVRAMQPGPGTLLRRGATVRLVVGGTALGDGSGAPTDKGGA